MLAILLHSPQLCAGDKKYATISDDQAREMLDLVEADIKENYYDPSFHGLNLDKRFEEARRRIAAAQSEDEAFLSIASAVAALNDSHTRFRPPTRPYSVDYGWATPAIGEPRCFATAVHPESDAAAKGLKPGDEILSVNGVRLVRQGLG